MTPPRRFRLDRSLSVSLARRPLLPKPGSRIPILMYHGISEKLSGKHPYYETSTAPETFAAHLEFLAENQYTTLTSGQLIAALDGAQANQVSITFDDGYVDFYTHGLPALKKHGFTAIMYIVSEFTGDERVTRNGLNYMTWREVREIHAAGIEIGSHTATHPELVKLSAEKVEDEVRRSKETIEDKLGAPVRSFAYPYAFPETKRDFTQMLRDSLQKHGYENGVCTIIGSARKGNDRYFLPRLPANSFDDAALFRAKLQGGYEWLHWFQYASKLATSVVG